MRAQHVRDASSTDRWVIRSGTCPRASACINKHPDAAIHPSTVSALDNDQLTYNSGLFASATAAVRAVEVSAAALERKHSVKQDAHLKA